VGSTELTKIALNDKEHKKSKQLQRLMLPAPTEKSEIKYAIIYLRVIQLLLN
jgi:hypothetical protein